MQEDPPQRRLTTTVVEVRSSVSDDSKEQIPHIENDPKEERIATPEPTISTLKPKPTTYRILSRPKNENPKKENVEEKKRRKRRRKRPRGQLMHQIRAQKAKIARLLMAALKNESLADHNPSKQDLAILKAQIQKLRSNLAPKVESRQETNYEQFPQPNPQSQRHLC